MKENLLKIYKSFNKVVKKSYQIISKLYKGFILLIKDFIKTFLKICKKINALIGKYKEGLKVGINIIAYIYIYFNLLYLLRMSFFNIMEANLFYYNIMLTFIYIVFLLSTFFVKSKSPYKIIIYILLLQIFI